MKAKHIIFGVLSLLGVLLIILIFRARKTSVTADMIDIGFYDFKFKFKLTDIPGMIVSLQVPAIATMQLNNFSKNDLTISQLKADIYTPSGVLLGSQDKPFSEAYVVKANNSNLLDLEYTINLPGIIDMVAARKKVDSTKGLLSDILSNYLKTGYIGEKAIMKGFVIPKELGIKIPLNDEIEF